MLEYQIENIIPKTLLVYLCLAILTLHEPATCQNKAARNLFDIENSSRFIKLNIEVTRNDALSFIFTDLAYNKKKGLMLMKDDGSVTDYSIVYKILSGGRTEKHQYPGFFYTDGTGHQIGYKYSFAINPNEQHTNTPGFTSWSQIKTISAHGHSFMNHTLSHGGSDKLKAIKDAEKNMWLHTGYRMTEFVPPSNDEGFVETALSLGYPFISSAFGEPTPDGNNEVNNQHISWGSYLPVAKQDFHKALISRTHLGDQWNAKELRYAKEFIDLILDSLGRKQIIGLAFSHGPYADLPGAEENFFKFIDYIKKHPKNDDNVWITSAKEFMDYQKTRSGIIITSSQYNTQLSRYQIVLDTKNIDANVTSRNLSLILRGGTIKNLEVSGAKATFNRNSGLINLYKSDHSHVKNPFMDILPPQIISLTANNNLITITYDKPVSQSSLKAYEITNNKVIKLSGASTKWILTMKDKVRPEQQFSYRMQLGNAIQTNHKKYRVCSYISMPIRKKD